MAADPARCRRRRRTAGPTGTADPPAHGGRGARERLGRRPHRRGGPRSWTGAARARHRL